MLKEKDFIDKIPQNCKIALFGAGTVGKFLVNYIKKERPDINIICFVDSFATGDIEGIKIYNIREIEHIKNLFDLLVFTTRIKMTELVEIFNYFSINYIMIPREVEKYCRFKEFIPKIELATNIFAIEKEKKLYKAISEIWFGSDLNKIQKYEQEHHGIDILGPTRNYSKQYFEHIIPEYIQTVFDAGVCNGVEIFVYKKKFKNLKAIYGFEPMYNKFKNENYDFFIKKMPEVTIINKGLWDYPQKLSFVESPTNNASSYIIKSSASRTLKDSDKIQMIETTTINTFKKENNIEKVDFIKMDIEGSELPALKGGEQTILSDRPQLAISIYHSIHDFVEIPIYLHNLLQDKDYTFHIGHYSPKIHETVFYAIPNELIRN